MNMESSHEIEKANAAAAAAAAAGASTSPVPTTEQPTDGWHATGAIPAPGVQEVPAASAADVPPPEQAAAQASAQTGAPAPAPNAAEVPVATAADVPPPKAAADQAHAATGTTAPAPAGTAEVPAATPGDVPPPEQAAAQAKEQTGTAPAGESATQGGPAWPELGDEHPLTEFLNKLPEALEMADYKEVYGITLNGDLPDFHTKLICQKFLRANHNFVDKSLEQLVDTLKWRKEYQPLKVKDEVFSKEKFEGLGYVAELEGVGWTSNKSDVVTFNVYGAVKDNKSTFGDNDAFLRWRIALMEMSIAALRLPEATFPIPDWGAGADPYQIIQVHDYLSVSFLRQDPHVKAASKKTIDLFQKVYPETLSRKYFVNVPTIMGWMFSAMKLFLSKDTVQKFTVLSSGDNLVEDLGEGVPIVYGGKAKSLAEIGTETKLEEGVKSEKESVKSGKESAKSAKESAKSEK